MSRRSSRPQTNRLHEISIRQLKEWNLLRVGYKSKMPFDNGVLITTNLASERPFCQIRNGKATAKLSLDSRRLGNGLVWYFMLLQLLRDTAP
jgi:hypothetical protein